jgi:hypothetical protein
MTPERPSQEDKNKSNGNNVPPPSGSVPPLDGNVPPKPQENFYNYFSSGSRDLIAYVLLVIGMILLFFQQYYGGFLIGLVAGAYFSEEINTLIKNYQTFIERQGLVRSLILGGLVIAFLISAPAIFVGIAFVVILKYFIFAESK